MPLQGRKIFHTLPPLTDIKPGEEIFTIEHTGEQFRLRRYSFMSKFNMAAPLACQTI